MGQIKQTELPIDPPARARLISTGESVTVHACILPNFIYKIRRKNTNDVELVSRAELRIQEDKQGFDYDSACRG